MADIVVVVGISVVVLSVIGRRALSVIELAGLKTRLRKVLSEGQGEFSRRVYESIS